MRNRYSGNVTPNLLPKKAPCHHILKKKFSIPMMKSITNIFAWGRKFKIIEDTDGPCPQRTCELIMKETNIQISNITRRICQALPRKAK